MSSPYEGPLPYEPRHCKTGGVYRIAVGRFFYIGSTRSLGSRMSEHKVRLERGEHPNAALQLAFDEFGTFAMTIVWLVPEKPREPKEDHRKRLKMLEQLELNRWFGERGCTNVSSDSGFNTKIGGWLKRKWEDPEFRASQLKRMGLRRGDLVSVETRGRMAQAKRGKKNPNSRKCTVYHDSKLHHFMCVSDAARHFGVSQQRMHAWLSGTTEWPGAGARIRKSTEHLRGMRGCWGIEG